MRRHLYLAIAIFIFAAITLSFRTWSPLFYHLPFSLPPVTDVVGISSFTGYLKQADLWIYYSFVFLITALFGWAGFLNRKSASAPLDSPLSPWSPTRAQIAFFIFCSALVSFHFLPPLHDWSLAIEPMKNADIQWDSLNITSWEALYSHGFLPYRDFWYPYGGQIYQGNASVFGLCFYAVHHAFVFISLYYLAARFSRSLWLGTLFVVYFLIQFHLGIIQTVHRYSFPIVLIGWMLLAIQNPRSRKWAVATGVSFAFLAFFELNLILGPLLGLIAICVLKLFEKRQKDFWLQILTIVVATFIPYFCWCLYLHHTGQWAGYLEFYSLGEFKAMSVYGGSPIPFWEMLKPSWNFEFYSFVIFMILIARLSYSLFRNRLKLNPEITFLLPATATAFLLFLKNMVRAWITHQLIAVLIPALFLSACFWLAPKRDSKWFKITAFILLAFLLISDARKVGRRIDYGFSELGKTISDPATFARFENVRKTHFEIETKTLSPDRQELLQFFRSEPTSKVYVVGDESWIYLALEQEMPFFINLYNASRVMAQQKTIHWLEQKNVAFVVCNQDHLEFDSVPSVVRAPLLFAYLTEHFALVKKMGHYRVFKRTESTTASDLSTWTEVLGNSIDLGAIPYATQIGKKMDCNNGEENCVPVLKIQSRTTEPAQNQIDLNEDSFHFVLKAKNQNLNPGYIRLDRLWFSRWTHPSALRFQSSTADLSLIWKKVDAAELY